MRQLVRSHSRFFLLLTAAAFAVRLLFLLRFRFVAGDSFIYGDIARNWLEHGVYALREGDALVPTYIRLPGYPAFLAAIWSIAGAEHYNAVMIAQVLLDFATCFVTAAIALRVTWERAALAAFALCALNPFTANYAATPLSETLAVFFAALALLCAVNALAYRLYSPLARGWWSGCGLAIAAGILLRPDGGLLLPAVLLYMVAHETRKLRPQPLRARLVLVTLLALAPLLPWAARNWVVFGRFQPLAPRYANGPDEFVSAGFIRWTKTWILDYVSVEDVYWRVPGEPLDVTALPSRAFDNAAQRSQTAALFDQYNQTLRPITPELDAGFTRLAGERIASSPLRYYLWLPLLRVADMWLRPRTEALPLDPHWWRYRQDRRDSLISLALGALNFLLLACALAGFLRQRVRYGGLFVVWVVLRCLLLATLENPEPRYTLECLPVVFVFAGAALVPRLTSQDRT